jgi:tight adherence protein C
MGEGSTALLAALVGTATAGGILTGARRWVWRRTTLDRVGQGWVEPGRVRRARRARRVAPDPVAGLPEVVDLLAVAAASGLPAPAALVAVGPRAPEPWRSAIADCVGRAAQGTLLTDALGHLPDAIGDPARPVVAVLRAGIADGGPLAADLARLAADARDLRRRRAEERARRIPVRLLLPLVCCSLPAFAVLSIVPIVAGVLDGLRFPSVPS